MSPDTEEFLREQPGGMSQAIARLTGNIGPRFGPEATLPELSRYDAEGINPRVLYTFMRAAEIRGQSALVLSSRLTKVHDHKGGLQVSWCDPYSEEDEFAFERAWEEVGELAENVSHEGNRIHPTKLK